MWSTNTSHRTPPNPAIGRNDLAVDLDSVDFNLPRHMPDLDESEFHVSRNFVYLIRIVRTMNRMIRAYSKVKRKKDWGIDPVITKFNPTLTSALNDLPADLAITFPPDGSPPWLPSHFIGNLHSYYYLSIVLGIRPQLTFLDPTNPDGQWKSHMMVAYGAAKALCRIQESMLQSFGLSGLRCMQRGISFTIYAILACLVLHLVRHLLINPAGLLMLTSTLGRHNITRSRSPCGRSRFFHAPHEATGKNDGFMASS